jgi:GNAT superfamily N-acetyltransferase
MIDARLREYVVRRARRHELAAVDDLRLASLIALEMPKRPLAAVAALRRLLPDIDEPCMDGGCYFVADLRGELIGGAGWTPLPEGWRAEGLFTNDGRGVGQPVSPDAVVLRGFFLDPDLGRRAVGANLLAHVEADVARAGHFAAELIVPESAQVMYRSLGYRPVGQFRLIVEGADALPVLKMRRSLPQRMTAAA